MNLVKFTIIIVISIFLSGLFLNSVTTIYKTPEFDIMECYESLEDCSDIISSHCGEDYSDFTCRSEAMQSPEYNSCQVRRTQAQKDCMTGSADSGKRHQTISYVILVLISILVLLTGFFISFNKTISFGVMGAGFLIFLSANFFASMAQILQGFSTGMASALDNPLKEYLTIFFYLVGSVILMVFTFLNVKD